MYFCLQPLLQQQLFIQDLPREEGVLKAKEMVSADVAGKKEIVAFNHLHKNSFLGCQSQSLFLVFEIAFEFFRVPNFWHFS